VAIWAEIKKAINSDFSKPLNELIAENHSENSENFNVLKRKVISGKTVTHSHSSSSTSKTTTVTGRGSVILHSDRSINSYCGFTKLIVDGQTIIDGKKFDGGFVVDFNESCSVTTTVGGGYYPDISLSFVFYES
jgi:hypothetical protein